MVLQIVVVISVKVMLANTIIFQSIILKTMVFVQHVTLAYPKPRGEFIYFVDRDDYLVGNLFAEFEDKLAPDLDLLVFSYYNSFEQELTERNRTKKSLPYRGSYDKYDFSKIFTDLFLSDMLYTVWNKFYRREFPIENNISFEKYELGEDVRFNLNVYRNVNRVYLSQESYYVYVIGRKGSAMSVYNLSVFSISFKS